MSAIAAHQKTVASLAEFRGRVSATLSALTALFASARKSAEQPWFTLNERLLNDIGRTPLEAEIAQLDARWGATVGASLNPLANRTLGP